VSYHVEDNEEINEGDVVTEIKDGEIITRIVGKDVHGIREAERRLLESLTESED
jgi:hypothetical protein